MNPKALFSYAVLLAVVSFFVVACTDEPTASAPLTVNFLGEGGGALTVTSDTGDTDYRQDFTADFPLGKTVSLTAAVDDGSVFTGWDGDCGDPGAAVCEVVMNDAKNVRATFDRVGAATFDLVVTKNGGGTVTGDPAGIICGSDCRETYAENSIVTLSAEPDAGSEFAGWDGDCTGTGACRVTMSATRTVTATFTEQPQLSVSLAGAGSVTSSPAGINCPATCAADFAAGTVVSLRATPAAGSSFAGWGGACTGTGACSLTLTADTSVTASFTENDTGPVSYPLTVVTTGGGAGTVSSTPVGISCGSDCTENFGAGTAVTLNATANAGSVFSGWQDCANASGDVCRVTLKAATQVTAVFKLEASGTVRTLKVPIRGTDPNNPRVSTDDAEQFLKKPTNNSLPANATDTTGGDLDLAYDTLNRTQQLVGLRFRGLNIPQGATIESAYIQFISDEDYAHTTFPNLTIRAEADPNAATFVHGAVNNISDRPVTAALALWEPPLWGDEKSATGAERSPDLSALVQEVVDYPSWNASSALVFILSGEPDSTAHRAATSHEDTDGPAQLFVTYRY